MKEKEILYILPSITIGGAEKLVVDLLSTLKKRGYKVSLLVLKDTNSFLEKKLILQGVSIYTLNLKSVYSFKAIFKIVPYLKKYDIIHVHLFPVLYWVALANLFCLSSTKAKLVYTEHSTYNKRRNKKYLRYIEKFIYSRYNRIISITDNVKKNLSEWLGYSDDGNNFIKTIYNGIDLLPFNNSIPYTKDRLGLPNDSIILFMAGRFTQAKDQQTIIRALKLLDNNKLFLLFAGLGETKSESEKLSRDLHLTDQVVFLGLRSDIPELIKSADICLLSSNWEGLPLVLVEYMSSNRPIIGSDVPGINDLIKDCGILFERGNETDLAKQIDFLINNQEKYKIIQEKCYKRSFFYDINKTVDNYIKIYETL